MSYLKTFHHKMTWCAPWSPYSSYSTARRKYTTGLILPNNTVKYVNDNTESKICSYNYGKLELRKQRQNIARIFEQKTLVKLKCRKSFFLVGQKNHFGKIRMLKPIQITNAKKIQTVTGISVTPFSVGWVTINIPKGLITNFEGYDITGKFNIQNLEDSGLKIANKVETEIPESDLYILENFSVWRKSKTETMFEVVLVSMLVAKLHNPTANPGNVLLINKSIVNYVFELYVQGERISTSQKLERMLSGFSSYGDSRKSELQFGSVKVKLTEEFMNKINNGNLVEKDATATAFFIAASFIEVNYETMNDDLPKEIIQW